MAQAIQRLHWTCLCLVFGIALHEGVLAAVTDPNIGPLITDSQDGDVLELKCTADKLSDPLANVAWRRDGPDGDLVNYATASEGDAATGTLKFTATTTFNVSGTGAVDKATTYACNVTRAAGNLWQAVITGDPTPRALRLEPSRDQLYYGDTLILACPNYGSQPDPDTLPADPLTVPSPQVEWQLNYDFSNPWNGSLPAGASVEAGQLIITNLGDSHVGSYTCQSTNVYSSRYASFPVGGLMVAPTTTAAPTTPNSGVAVNNTGAIVGGVIGGIIAAIILGALAYFGYQHFNKSQGESTKYTAAASDPV